MKKSIFNLSPYVKNNVAIHLYGMILWIHKANHLVLTNFLADNSLSAIRKAVLPQIKSQIVQRAKAIPQIIIIVGICVNL